MKIQRALLSVSDKTGLLEFAEILSELGIEIVSTGGTARLLRDAGLNITNVADVTGFPEILNGRVKTLHPHIHGGILADPNNENHINTLREHGIQPFQLIVVNLYPFEQTVRNNPDNREAAIENIDIGGPCMIRAAAKNYQNIGIVSDPSDYPMVISSIQTCGTISEEIRKQLALKAFRMTAEYDSIITRYFEQNIATSAVNKDTPDLPDAIQITLNKQESLRYGENPHQQAAIYRDPVSSGSSIISPIQHSGKPLSFNNILDMKAAWEMAMVIEKPAAIVVKHQNPCGAAAHDTSIKKAYESALGCDPMSAYGGIVALNRIVEEDLAEQLHRTKFLEVIVAPGYSDAALQKMKKKKNRRLIEIHSQSNDMKNLDIRIMEGGALIQENDRCIETHEDFRVVTTREPSDAEWKDLHFGWKICRFVKSNAIVLVKDQTAFGVGAGQMSRVDSAWIASRKAGDRIQDGIMASDAFFPFSDGIEIAAETGITAVIQPGGSIRDEEVIEACNRLNIAMVFTGFRHFRH